MLFKPKNLLIITMLSTFSLISVAKDCYLWEDTGVQRAPQESCSINIVDGEGDNCEEGQTQELDTQLISLSLGFCNMSDPSPDIQTIDITNKNQPRVAMAFLKSLQDPRVKMTPKALSLMIGILHSSFYEKYPKLISRALFTTMVQQPSAYYKIVKDHPKLLELDSTTVQSLCLNMPEFNPNVEDISELIIKSLVQAKDTGLVREWSDIYDLAKVVSSFIGQFEEDIKNAIKEKSMAPAKEMKYFAMELIEFAQQYEGLLPYLSRDKKEEIIQLFDEAINKTSIAAMRKKDLTPFLSIITRKLFYPEKEERFQAPVFLAEDSNLLAILSTVKKEGFEKQEGLPHTYIKEFTFDEVLQDAEKLKLFSPNLDEFKKLIRSFINNHISETELVYGAYGSSMPDWNYILKPELMQFFSKEEKEKIIDKLSDLFVIRAQIEGVKLDPSSTYYMSYNALASKVGLEKKSLIKFDTREGQNSIETIIASSEAIDDQEKPNLFGFYLKTSPLQIPDNIVVQDPSEDETDKSIVNFQVPLSFKQGQKEYQVTLDINRSDTFIPVEHDIESPDYEKMDENGIAFHFLCISKLFGIPKVQA
jgi:hypothetical protein